MTSLNPLSHCLLAVTLTACGNSTGPQSVSTHSSQVQRVANDCRAPSALSSQRGCRPATRAMAGR